MLTELMWFSKWGLSDLLSRRCFFPWQRIGRKRQRRKRDQANILQSSYDHDGATPWRANGTPGTTGVTCVWFCCDRGLARFSTLAMYPWLWSIWPWHWPMTIGQENWWSPNDLIGRLLGDRITQPRSPKGQQTWKDGRCRDFQRSSY